MWAAVVLPSGTVCPCDDIPEAEALIEVFEQIDPERVHDGQYSIDADEAADAAYQSLSRK